MCPTINALHRGIHGGRGKIDMLTHTNSSNKNVLDKKHHIEVVSYTFCRR